MLTSNLGIRCDGRMQDKGGIVVLLVLGEGEEGWLEVLLHSVVGSQCCFLGHGGCATVAYSMTVHKTSYARLDRK